MKKNIEATQGWEQFLNNKIQMLYSFEISKKFSQSHKVQVSHGHTAEALFRKWLTEFLPEKYGVSSGYIISQHKDFWGKTELPHYDVLIYDRMNSPILWVEKNDDQSAQGKYRAFPVEYVRAVIEIKSNMTKETVKDMVKKINELECLIDKGGENTFEAGKLSNSFFCASVFFEINKESAKKINLEEEYFKIKNLNNFYGTCILSAEDGSIKNTGLIKKMNISNEIKDKLKETKNEEGSISLIHGGWHYSDDSDQNASFLMTWQKFNFAMFAFDLVAMLNGTYNQNKLSSLYGFTFEDFEKY